MRALNAASVGLSNINNEGLNMWTISYKGWFIAGYCDRSECHVILPKGGHWATVKSLMAAKRKISKDSQWVKDKTQ